MPSILKSDAYAQSYPSVFSEDLRFRYVLWRVWNKNLPYCMFVGLNPSTADDVQDDPTVRRCIRYAMSWGYGALCMTNAFGFRATDPAEMKAQLNAIGYEGDAWLRTCAREAGIVIVAWGVHGAHDHRDREVLAVLRNVGVTPHCLGKTKAGQPRHPLYLKKDLKPVPFKEDL